MTSTLTTLLRGQSIVQKPNTKLQIGVGGKMAVRGDVLIKCTFWANIDTQKHFCNTMAKIVQDCHVAKTVIYVQTCSLQQKFSAHFHWNTRQTMINCNQERGKLYIHAWLKYAKSLTFGTNIDQLESIELKRTQHAANVLDFRNAHTRSLETVYRAVLAQYNVVTVHTLGAQRGRERELTEGVQIHGENG